MDTMTPIRHKSRVDAETIGFAAGEPGHAGLADKQALASGSAWAPRPGPDALWLVSAAPEAPATRHIVVGVSDPSADPSRHRVFHIAAVYDAPAAGWRAAITEENANAQPGPWRQRSGAHHQPLVAPTAAVCLGRAVALIVAVIATDDDQPSLGREH